MKCLQIAADRNVVVVDVETPALRLPSDVRVRISWVSLNRLDLFSSEGMAFAKQALPMIAGVEGAGIVEAVGSAVESLRVGDRVVIFPGIVCGECKNCSHGKENLCTRDALIRGFHVDGVAAESVVVPARHLLAVPDGVRMRDAACVPVTAATVEHMLNENARLCRGETVLIQAGGSGIGSLAISLSKHLGATVITTVGSEAKAIKARQLGADFVINYNTENFPSKVRRFTEKRGVDVVFEHVGAQTWDGSLRSLALGGRLVTCGSHTGTTAQTNLLHLFNRQIRIYASFGGNYRNVRESLRRLATQEIAITVDRELAIDEVESGLSALRGREIFGKVLLRLPGYRAEEEVVAVATDVSGNPSHASAAAAQRGS